MKNWLRELIVDIVIQNITIGGHCGLCGTWVERAIVPVYWRWTICEKCAPPNTARTRLETGAANADSESNPAVSSG